MLEKGTQTPSPSPGLFPAENERPNLTGDSHSSWHCKRGHFIEVSGYIDRTFVFIECHEHADGITSLALSAGGQLGVDHHHVAITHVHQ